MLEVAISAAKVERDFSMESEGKVLSVTPPALDRQMVGFIPSFDRRLSNASWNLKLCKRQVRCRSQLAVSSSDLEAEWSKSLQAATHRHDCKQGDLPQVRGFAGHAEKVPCK